MKKLLLIVFLSLVAFQTAKAQGKWTLGAGGEVLLPTGDFSSKDYLDAKMGFGGSARAQYLINRQMAITGSLGYEGWSSDAGGNYVDLTFTNIPLSFGFKYLFGREKIRFYLLGEVGLNFWKSKATGKNGYSFSYDKSATLLGVAPSAGVEIALDKDVTLEGAIRYQILGSDKDATGDKAPNHFGLRVGVNFGL